MPVPFLAAGAIVARVVAAIRSLGWLQWLGIGAIVEKVYSGDLKDEINGAIAEEAAARAGIVLDRNDPLSDASLAGAVYQKTGIPLRSLRDQAMIIEDVDAWAASLVSAKSGYVIRSVSNVPILKEDMRRVACAVLTERLGIPAGVLPGDGEEFNPEAIKGRLLAWAKAELFQKIGDDIGIQIDEILAVGDLESAAAEINSLLRGMNSGFEVTGRKLALTIANQLAAKSITEYQQVVQGDTKGTRRRLQNRKAQERFRAKHGNRQKYVPLNMSAVIG